MISVHATTFALPPSDKPPQSLTGGCGYGKTQNFQITPFVLSGSCVEAETNIYAFNIVCYGRAYRALSGPGTGSVRHWHTPKARGKIADKTLMEQQAIS